MANKALEEGQILHFGSVRIKTTGGGVLISRLISSDDAIYQELPDIDMSPATNREPTILANMNEQSAQLECKTTEMGDTFYITKIVIFIKPVGTGYPQ